MARFNWTRDELILALDLYFREPKARGSKTHLAVHELSELLNRLPIHPFRAREEFFRNPNGVGMKLGNFLRLDGNYRGKGLTRGNRLEGEVWDEFAEDLPRLRRVAAAIKGSAESKELQEFIEDDPEDDAEAAEGRLLTRLHKVRERSKSLAKRKKRSVLKQTGSLRCEVCGFDFHETYGSHGEGFAECHHLTPLEELRAGSRTRLKDLAIVCANCHRMIHRKRPWLGLDQLKALIEHA